MTLQEQVRKAISDAYDEARVEWRPMSWRVMETAADNATAAVMAAFAADRAAEAARASLEAKAAKLAARLGDHGSRGDAICG